MKLSGVEFALLLEDLLQIKVSEVVCRCVLDGVFLLDRWVLVGGCGEVEVRLDG